MNERMPTVTIEPEPIDSADARFAIEQYVRELDGLFPAGFDASRAASSDPSTFSLPHGVFLLVRFDEEVAGCGALRTTNGVGEIKRMWLSPMLRGRGVGRSLLRELERHAHEYGCRRVRLDTAAELHAAKALYERAGYVEIPDYNGNPYARHWFEKVLA